MLPHIFVDSRRRRDMHIQGADDAVLRNLHCGIQYPQYVWRYALPLAAQQQRGLGRESTDATAGRQVRGM